VAGSVTRAYDTDFRMTSLSVNGANPIGFQFDPDDLLTVAGELTLTRHPQNGLITKTAIGKVAEAFGYSGFGEIMSYHAAFDGSEVYDIQFARDPLGRVTEKTETIGGVTSILDYSYDGAGRLSEIRKNGAIAGTYTYDLNGNRLTGPAVATTYTHDAQDRLTQSSASGLPPTVYTHTAHGELARKTSGAAVTTYQYDAQGNLLQVTLPAGTTIDYVMDGRNRRVAKRVDGAVVQKFLYVDQLKPIVELDSNDAIITRFIYATRANVPAYMVRGGQTHRIITDDLGSPRLVIEVSGGAILQRMDYDEFGNVVTDTNPGFQPFGFAGGLYDPLTKLTRYGLRDYDPEIGRWTRKDPLGFGGGGSNLYAYVQNDPVNWVDPFGLDQGYLYVSQPGAAGDGYLNWNINHGGRPVSNINELVGKALAEWINTGEQISNLTLAAHGNPNGFQMGKEWVSDFSPLSALGPALAPDATILFKSCMVGQNKSQLENLSLQLPLGVVIYAATGYFYPENNEGNLVHCQGGECDEIAGRWSFPFNMYHNIMFFPMVPVYR
jgi:RHS repeat-associated protein